MAYIERTTATDPEKSFSVHWPSYKLALMLGPEHFGLPIGEIFNSDGTTDPLHTICSKGHAWFEFMLPPPFETTFGRKATCFIVLLLFLLFPKLRFIPAFNKGGADWTRDLSTRTEPGQVLVGHDPLDGRYANIYCRNITIQSNLRKIMLEHYDPAIKFLGHVHGLKNFSAALTHLVAIRSAKRGADFLQGEDDSEDEVEPEIARAFAILLEAGYDLP